MKDAILGKNLSYGYRGMDDDDFNEFRKDDAWNYDFTNEPVPSHCEKSYLAERCFEQLCSFATKLPDLYFDDGNLKINGQIYRLDIMNNPNPDHGIYTICSESGMRECEDTRDECERIYHTIGNIALVPHWPRYYGDWRSYQSIHRWYGEWWDLTLQDILLTCFDTSQDAKNYIKVNCLFMYFPQFYKKLSEVVGRKQEDAAWIEYINGCISDLEDISCKDLRVGDLCSSEDEFSMSPLEFELEGTPSLSKKCCDEIYNTFRKMINDAQVGPEDAVSAIKRINWCIEARGRCIMAILRNHDAINWHPLRQMEAQ